MNANTRAFAPLAGAAVLAALVVAVSFWAFRQIELAAESRSHAYDLVTRATALWSDLTDAETGQRGFALTGDESFLQPYAAVRDGIAGRLQKLHSLTRIDAARRNLDALIPLVDAKMTEMAGVIELKRRRETAAVLAAVGSGRGKQLMESIRTEIDGYAKIEEAALARYDTEFKANMRHLFAIIVASSLLALALTLWFAHLIRRGVRQELQNLVHAKTLQTNAALQVSEEKLKVTLNSIGDAVLTTDADGRVTLLNPLAEQLTGWKQADAAGRPVGEIFNIINQETRKPSTVPVMSTLANGTVQGLANHTILIARDGSERTIADSCAPIRERDGRIVGAVLVFRDVTSTEAARVALRDSTALIEAILGTAVDGIITLHANGGLIERANTAAERMFGYAADEIAGKPFRLLIPELGQDQKHGSLEYFAASNESLAAGRGREVTGRRKDGSVFTLEIATSELWLGGKRYFTGMLRDITGRKQIEAERNLLDQTLKEKNTELENATIVAEKANLAKSDFLSSMSHELRTPLNAILGFAQLMETGTPPPTPSQKRNVDQILKAGWYLLELINEILDLALIESGKVTLSAEPVSLVEVMLECRAMIEPQAQKRGVAMTFPRFDFPQFVRADRTRVKQVLINLLFNAIKYNRPGGTVAVECTPGATGSIRISVRDTGAGLSPAQVAMLFHPFNRLGKEAGAEEGTGIGLVVTKRLVELMGGVIGVESTIGVGSVFWVELHLTTAPLLGLNDADRAALARPEMEDGTPLRTLLYVEDNPANLELVEQIIARRPDLRLLSAADGDLGIEFARAYLPEVILMDIHLPGISGIEAMKILRSDPLTAHIPIIALSANAVPRDIERALEAGFFNYLTKPIKVNQFNSALDLALKHSLSGMGPLPTKEAA